jgi:ABC-2 type transport system permease protein
MSFSVIQALVLRHLFLYARSPVRLVELLFWPVMELVVWGNLAVWLEAARGGPSVPVFIPALIGGVILWDVVFRAQQGVAISFLEDVWTRNLLNIFAAPVRPVEYVASGFVVGFLRIAVTVAVLALLAGVAYHFNIFLFSWHLLPFFGLLMMFGWSLGMISSALILRWGQAAESLAWAVPFLIQPLAAVYYPLSVLPGWAQSLALCLPCAPVFEGMRAVVAGQPVNWNLLGVALGTNVVWMLVATGIYLWVLKNGRERGTLTRVTAH